MRLFFIRLTQVQVFIMTFATIIVIGAALLTCPFAAEGRPVSWINALFTATSAMCVTGLIVVDTGTRFTAVGQAVILLLIQVGGLGIMTFSTFILLVIGRKIGISGSYLIQDNFSHSGSLKIGRLILLVIVFTALMELAGALVLFFVFRPHYSTGYAAWSAIFHAISAFCNAGFSLNENSFCAFRGDYALNIVITVLIIMGGIGFPVLHELIRYTAARRRGRHTRLNIHTRIVLSMTIVLLIVGTLLFYAAEPQCHNAERGLLTAWFQSVTCRTAGFNTIDFSQASDASLLLSEGLMFIGGSSGSTAGGIKTTTFMVILILVWTHIRGKPRPEFGQRTISHENTIKTFTLLAVFLMIAAGALGALLVLHADAGIPDLFRSMFFEVISAIGTVGLSTGITPHLTAGGKIILVFVMFIGRLGPLAIARLFVKESSRGNYRYPEENLMIG